MTQALAALGMGSTKYPTVITSFPGIRLVNQYQATEHATPMKPPASPAARPFRQVMPAILLAQSRPTMRAGTKVSSKSSHQWMKTRRM